MTRRTFYTIIAAVGVVAGTLLIVAHLEADRRARDIREQVDTYDRTCRIVECITTTP